MIQIRLRKVFLDPRFWDLWELFIYLFKLLEREREPVRGHREGRGERRHGAGSTPSVEPDVGLNVKTLRSQPGVGGPTVCATQVPLIHSSCVLQSLAHRVRVVIIFACACGQSSLWYGWTTAPAAPGWFSPRTTYGPFEEGAQILIAIREPSIDTF